MAGQYANTGMGLRRTAFVLLVAGCLVLTVAVVWGGAVYPGYDHARQFMSELGATGSVTGPAVNRFGYIPNGIFFSAFCLIAAWLLRHSALALASCLLLAGNGLGMTGAGVYPCDFECSRSDASGTAVLHDLFGVVGYLCALFGIGLAALWARKSTAPWLTPIGVVALVVCIAGLQAVIADVELKGLFQRAMEAAIAIFMLALGWALMHGLRATSSERS